MPGKPEWRGEPADSTPDASPLVIDPKVSLLPLGELGWERFEELVLEVVQQVEKPLEIQPYGLRGQGQHGIDFVARTASGEWHAFQVKQVKDFGLAGLRGIIDAFLAADPRPFKARRLVIATSCDRISTQVQKAIFDYGRDHPDVKFDQIWDAGELNRRLRRLPQIVARYFGEAAAQRFCDEDSLLAAGAPPGRPVREACNPFDYDVHEAIRPSKAVLPVPGLPTYVPRGHDGDLEKVASRALAGTSGLAVLLGDSSSGKTRSAWEQVQRLPEGWRLWHPASPDELLEKLPRVAPCMVLWLNELHLYMLTDDVHRDETAAARLLELIRDPARGPVLILGTLWHQYRVEMVPAESDNDLRPQVRALISGRFIPVPETFSSTELRVLETAAESDPALAEAWSNAEQGQITQYLAGGPAQVERYLTAAPAAKAVLRAAMDARRLGWGLALPAGFLKEAALSFLTELQQDNLPTDWFEQALKYLLPPSRGARGPLWKLRVETEMGSISPVSYRLADYLEQFGRHTRSLECPQSGFWLAALRDEVAASDRATLARAAYTRSRSEIAYRLARASMTGDNASGIASFAYLIEQEEGRKASLPYFLFAAEHGDTWSQVRMGWWYEDKGEWETAGTWYSRADDGKNPAAIVGRAAVETRLGHRDEAESLYEHALNIGGARSVEFEARELASEGAHNLALSLAERSFSHGNYEALTGLAWTYMLAKDPDRAFGVMTYAMKLGFPNAVTELMILSTMVDDIDRTLAYCELGEQTGAANALRIAGTILARFGNERRAASLLWRASNIGSDHWVSFSDTYAGGLALQELGELRESQGRIRSARRIYRKLARRGSSYALVKLAASYEQAGASVQAEQLAETYERVAAPSPSNAGWLAVAEARHERGDADGAERLLWELVEDGDAGVLRNIADLRLKMGDRTGAEEVLRLAVDGAVPGAKESMSKLEQAD